MASKRIVVANSTTVKGGARQGVLRSSTAFVMSLCSGFIACKAMKMRYVKIDNERKTFGARLR